MIQKIQTEAFLCRLLCSSSITSTSRILRDDMFFSAPVITAATQFSSITKLCGCDCGEEVGMRIFPESNTLPLDLPFNDTPT